MVRLLELEFRILLDANVDDVSDNTPSPSCLVAHDAAAVPNPNPLSFSMLDPVFRIKRRQAALEDFPHALGHSSQVVGMHTVQQPLKVRLVIVGRVSEYCNQSGRAP